MAETLLERIALNGSRPRGAAAVLRASGLSMCYGQRLVVKQLNLGVRRGEMFGLPGPNGTGKTTSMRRILGLIPPTAARVKVLSQESVTQMARELPRVGTLLTPSPDGRGRMLTRVLVEAGFYSDTLSPDQESLEDIFLPLTGNEEQGVQ